MNKATGLAVLVAAALVGLGCKEKGVIVKMDYKEIGAQNTSELTFSHKLLKDNTIRVHHAYGKVAKDIHFAFAEGDTAIVWYNNGVRVE